MPIGGSRFEVSISRPFPPPSPPPPGWVQTTVLDAARPIRNSLPPTYSAILRGVGPSVAEARLPLGLGVWISTCGFPATQATSTDDGIANFVERRTLGRAFSRPWRAPEGVEGRVGRTGGTRWRLRPNGGWQDGVARRTPRPPPATPHGGAAVVLRTHREMREAESPQDRP